MPGVGKIGSRHQKSKNLKSIFFDFLTIKCDGKSCLDHSLDPLCPVITCFDPERGAGGSFVPGIARRGLREHPSGGSKIEKSKIDFLNFLTM